MQRFRLLPAVITISLFSTAVVAHADDTAAQAAARAALMQQMNQMDTEQGSSNFMTAPAAATNSPSEAQQPPAVQAPAAQQPAVEEPAAQPAVQPPPISQPTPQFSTNIPVVTPPETGPAGPAEVPEPSELSKPTGTPDTSASEASAPMTSVPQTSPPVSAQEKAQANATASAMTIPPPSVLTNDAAQYPVNPPLTPLPPSQGDTSTPTPEPTPAIDDQMPAPGSESAAPSNPAGKAVGPGGASLTHETQGTNSAALEQITAPPLPISPEKQAELQNLLHRYMANQVTPVQYQEERARIMAEP